MLAVQKCFDQWKYKALTSRRQPLLPVPTGFHKSHDYPEVSGYRKPVSPPKRSPIKQRTPPRLLTDTVRGPSLPLAVGAANLKLVNLYNQNFATTHCCLSFFCINKKLVTSKKSYLYELGNFPSAHYCGTLSRSDSGYNI